LINKKEEKMAYWRYTKRKLNGKLRNCKVKRFANGKTLVRVVGHRNSSDRTSR